MIADAATCRGAGRVLVVAAMLFAAAGNALAGTGVYDFSIYPEFANSESASPSSTSSPVSEPVSPTAQQPAVSVAESEQDDEPLISEIRFGVLAHNYGPLASRTETGVDINPELLFRSPEYLDVLWAPRPMAGAVINTNGDTNFLYGGLMWDFDIVGDVFGAFSFGMAIHDGNYGDDEDDEGLRALGCKWLFRESIEAGYRFTETVAMSLYLDHVSHGGICGDRNRGMDNSGARIHYRF